MQLQKDFHKALFPELARTERVLLGPGPSMVHPRVLQAMAAPMVGHLDPYFLEIMDRTQDMLRYVFQTENRLTIPISGTGSAAMEAAVANFVEPGTPVLICINGYFGNRLLDMARRYGGDASAIYRPWGDIFTPGEIRNALSARPAKVVAIVNAETLNCMCFLSPKEKICAASAYSGSLFANKSITIFVSISSFFICISQSNNQHTPFCNQNP